MANGKLYIFIFIFLSFSIVKSQEIEFSADRPGLADSPDIMQKNIFQVESGISYSMNENEPLILIPTNLFRYGIIDKFLEARFNITLQYDPDTKVFGTVPMSVGIKVFLWNEQQLLPKSGIVSQITLPTFEDAPQPIGIYLEWCFNNDLGKNDNLYYSVNATWNDIKIPVTIFGLIGFDHDLYDDWQLFLEVYSFKQKGFALDIGTDFGFGYQLCKKVQLDFSIGVGLKYPKQNYFIDAGIAYQF